MKNIKMMVDGKIMFYLHNSSKINQIKEMLTTLAEIEKIIFPVHPSIKNRLDDFIIKM